MKHRRLTQAVLASTIFIAPLAFAQGPTTITTQQINQATNTFTAGNIEITSTGQLYMFSATNNNGDAIVVDSTPATVTLDPNNTSSCMAAYPIGGTNCAILTIGTARHGINITTDANGTGTSAVVTVGSGTAIEAVSNGINVDAGQVSITNSGTIFGAQHAIYLTNNGQGATIVNNQNAILQSQFAQTVWVQGIGLNFTNAGSIATTNNTAAIYLNSDFTSITNSSTGTITSQGGFGAIRMAVNTSGNIFNYGVIQNTMGGVNSAGIRIDGVATGTITNAGTIETTSPAGSGSAGIVINNNFNSIINSGTILATTAGNFGINVCPTGTCTAGTVTSGTINNSGTIQTVNQTVVNLATGSITALINSGTLTQTSAATINPTISGNVGSITNSGYIINHNPAGNAIDLSKVGVNVPITQTAGLIQGNVLTAGGGGTVLNLSGGMISGDVTTATAPAANNTFNLTGGSITGTLSVGNGSSDNVNIGGTSLQTINGGTGGATGNIFTLTGGNFTNLIGGTNAKDQLIVNASFTPDAPGTISGVPTITVNNAGTVFTTVGNITGLNTALTINAGASMVVNSMVIGNAATITNAGSLSIGSAGSLTMTKATLTNTGTVALYAQATPSLSVLNFTQNPMGALAPQIQSTTLFGSMTVANLATLNANTTVNPFLGSGSYIPQGFAFPILTTTIAAGLTDNSTLVQPNSVIISFDKVDTANTIFLITERNTYGSQVLNCPNALPIANVLDAFTTPTGPADPTLLELLGQLDIQTSQQALCVAIESLGPPMNYAMPEAMHIGQNMNFDTIIKRIEEVKGVSHLYGENIKVYRDVEGINYGDGETNVGTWAKGFGDYVVQKELNNVQGYQADAIGLAIGADWSLMEESLVGLALSGTKVHVVGKTSDENVQDLTSYQATFYGFFQPTCAMYFDTLIGLNYGNFDNRRNIGVGDLYTAAFAKFNGVQFGGQIDTGYVYAKENVLVAPIGRIKYTYLMLDDYTETGAEGLSLSVINNPLHEFLVGAGFRLAAKNDFVQATYIPEVSIMYLYDFCDQGEATVANFLGGGSAFATNGLQPGRNVILFDLGVTADTNDNYVFTVKYQIELRNEFMSNSGYIKLYHLWN